MKSKIANAVSFSDMMSLVRQVWIMDVGGRIDVLNDEPLMVGVWPGVWMENREVLGWMRENTGWWSAHFVSCADDFYVFEE